MPAPATSITGMTLTSDSGTSSTDNDTNSSTLTFNIGWSNTSTSAVTYYVYIGTHLLGSVLIPAKSGATTSGTVAFTASSTLSAAGVTDGTYTVTVQTAATYSAATPVFTDPTSVTIDTAASAPTFALMSDTGSSGDGITSNGQVNVSGLESGATWQYSTDGGTNWNAGTGTSFTLAAGTYSAGAIKVTQTDVAGNTSTNGTNAGAITIDTSAAAPSVALASDTGSSGDGITSNGQVNVSGLESGATWQYSTDGGTNWNAGTGTSFTLAAGTYSAGAIKVTQTDVAGNTSTNGTNAGAITVDTSAPANPSITTVHDDQGIYQYDVAPGASTDDTTPVISGTAEAGAAVKVYDGATLVGTATADGSGNWTAISSALGTGPHSFTATATDAAGNVSGLSSSFGITVDPLAVCYLKGTRIATPKGEVAVEDLSIGDHVINTAGAARPIKWIGRRSYVTRFVSPHSRRGVLPVRIASGALGESIPKRDLFISPEHALCLEGNLVPVRHLVNGMSIAYCDSFDTIEYYHIELPSHDVLLADGAPAESWLDCGNRNFFMNVVDYLALGHAEEAPSMPCLPIVTEGALVARLRTDLAKRAFAAGYGTTTDPGIHLVADGQRFEPKEVTGKVCRFELPACPSRLSLGSLTRTPADMDLASTDSRQLGISLTRIVLRSAETEIQIGHKHPLLTDGFHPAESNHRWTNGRANIPPQFFSCLTGPVQVEVHVATLTAKYPARIEPAVQAVAGTDGKSRIGGHLRLAA
jgi:hypothetical protein